MDVDDARGGTVYQPHHLIVHSEPRARAGASVAAARVGDQRQAFAFAPDYSSYHAAPGLDPNLVAGQCDAGSGIADAFLDSIAIVRNRRSGLPRRPRPGRLLMLLR